MHHYIYPEKDTFITNRTSLNDKNFGIDEILQIGTTNDPVRTLALVKDYVYTGELFSRYSATSYTGIFTGSFAGTSSFVSGSISGSGLTFTASYFTGSIDGVVQVVYGSVSGSLINGYITGAVYSPYQIGIFTGHLTGSDICMTGTGSGTDTRAEEKWTTITTKFIDRSLLKFDLTSIFASIADGTIVSPKFSLKVKICNEYDLPIVYTVYALPVSQSWNMGDGYLSDGGSDEGVSWDYRDNNDGTPWYNVAVSGSRTAIDFISNLAQASSSFGYGGGTWFTSSICSQSFQYQSSDINMDVTPIVMAWYSASLPNEGFLLLHSDELQSTGSGFILKFYSRDTNTIYYPYLDVKWNDVTFVTGSTDTSSVVIITISAGISGSVQSGSTFTIAGGVSGSFSGSTTIITFPNYITASGQAFDPSYSYNVLVNNTWYGNNGIYPDSWLTSWYLDPYSGGFLPRTYVTQTVMPVYGNQPTLQFTGSFTGSFRETASYAFGSISGSGQFSASYFTGSVDGVSQEITSGSVSGSLITGSLVGEVMTVNNLGLFTGQLTSSLIYLTGTGSGYYLDVSYFAFTGFVDGTGLTGNIIGVPIYGSVNGIIYSSQSYVTGSCGATFSASLAKGYFYTGPFSGSTFVAYYIDNKFENAVITGSWPPGTFIGGNVNITLPSRIDPYAYAYVTSSYGSGRALGTYTIFNSTSASFSGQFIDGNLIGGFVNFQLSGSAYTSSYSYTSSIELSSSVSNEVDVTRPFTITLQNVHPTYKAGDIVKIGVFARKQFPLKDFTRGTQQQQYLIPECLPSSSYYALKDTVTDEIIMNFDSYTRLSCEYPYGNYFMIDTTSLPQDRYYQVLIRVESGQASYTFDSGKTFKVTR